MWFAFLVLALAAVAVILIGWYGWLGKLPRQHIAGIRTPYTMRSDEHWNAVHRYGSPYLIFGGVAVLAISLAVFPFAVGGALPGTFSAAVALAAALVMLGAVLASWYFGVRAAKAQLGE